ncbi:ATP-binding protein [Streptomyces niveiscabiei]|uniref:ATP-binding protein n=1 Tax=Streptomyces niveiscabiei TaxID=164115 RepID=UPI0029B9B1CD|nr:ATP-binding protein [Streptomyces niveiscabiei]MDX3388251.1 ATP-binding protein [Streptomyces niveiscabiei]
MRRRDPQHPTYEFTIPATVEAVPTARRRVVTLARRLGLTLSDDLLNTVELLAGEVIANAVLYSGAPCGIAVTRNVESVRIEVTDGNPSLPTVTEAGPDDENGRGLLLVDTLADDWGTRLNAPGKATWFEILCSSPNTALAPSSPTVVAQRPCGQEKMSSLGIFHFSAL